MVWVQIVCIRNDSSTKLTVSREGLTHEILMKTSYLHPVLILCIPVMCRAHASLCEMLTHKLPAKKFLSSIA